MAQVNIKDFIGEVSYKASILRSKGEEPEPGPGDIRRLVTEYCILPMGQLVPCMATTYI